MMSTISQNPQPSQTIRFQYNTNPSPKIRKSFENGRPNLIKASDKVESSKKRPRIIRSQR